MDIKIDKKDLSVKQLESLTALDEELKDKIVHICTENKGYALQVEYGTALVAGVSGDSFKLSHNASFDLRGSYVIVDCISSVLKDFFSKNKFPDSELIVNLTFSRKSQESIRTKPEEKKREPNTENTPTFTPIKPKYSFDKIILPQHVLDDLMNAVNIIMHRDLIFYQWGYNEIDPFARCIINMYGPAGTGKTMSAHAIADKVGKKLLALNYSEIESKYLGEAAKNLAAAFKVAKESDSVLFFDEADSFLGKRIQNVTQSSDQALNSLRSQMLILLENFEGVVIFATNLVSNFDEAFMSRIQKHIKFELPNAEQVAEILKKQIPSKLPLAHDLSQEDYDRIGKCGEGLSGREIKNAIFELLLKKAGKCGNPIFSSEDFSEALTAKIESNKRVAQEKDRMIKERIMKKIAERVQEKEMEKEMNLTTPE